MMKSADTMKVLKNIQLLTEETYSNLENLNNFDLYNNNSLISFNNFKFNF